eukprot:scaffold118447_cov88-Attheya_sp.AAC.1
MKMRVQVLIVIDRFDMSLCVKMLSAFGTVARRTYSLIFLEDELRTDVNVVHCMPVTAPFKLVIAISAKTELCSNMNKQGSSTRVSKKCIYALVIIVNGDVLGGGVCIDSDAIMVSGGDPFPTGAGGSPPLVSK